MDQDLDIEIQNAVFFYKFISLLNIRCVVDLKDDLTYILIFLIDEKAEEQGRKLYIVCRLVTFGT